MMRLADHSWPGNVRELQNALARAAIVARGRPILPEDFVNLAPSIADLHSNAHATSPLALKEILADTERRVIAQALDEAKWNRTHAAHLLGISRRQLFDKIKQYGLAQ
jgi:DNA-binding NtrC family response regulator